MITAVSPQDVLPALKEREVVSRQSLVPNLQSPVPNLQSPISSPHTMVSWHPAITQTAYNAAIGRVKEYIARGHTYQVNYTFPLRSRFTGDGFAYFADMTAAALCGIQRQGMSMRSAG